MAPEQPQEQGEGQGSPMEMIKQIDAGLQQITQLLAQGSEELAKAMQEVNDRFRAIIEEAQKQAQGGNGGGQRNAPSQERPQNAGAADVRQAY